MFWFGVQNIALFNQSCFSAWSLYVEMLVLPVQHLYPLKGPIPDAMSSFTQLLFLSLAMNQLSGSIPTGLLSLKMLSRLHLYQNQLSGSLDIRNFKFHKQLVVSDNQLTVRLPQDLEGVQSLVTNGNMIEGTLPDMQGAGTLESPFLSITIWAVSVLRMLNCAPPGDD